MSKGLKRTLYTLVLGTGIYSLIGFLIAPGIAQRIANQQLAAHALVPAKIERIELNPFSLEVQVFGLHIGEAEQPQIAFRRLSANLQLDSLWGPALHLKSISADALNIQIAFAKDGTLNLSQLFRAGEPKAEEEATNNEPPLALNIDQLSISNSALHFSDQRTPEPILFEANDLDFVLENLSTLPEHQAKMRLSANTTDGGQLRWQGNLSLSPIQSEGELHLSAAQLRPWWPYVEQQAPLKLTSGQLDVSLHYQLDLAEQTQLRLQNSQLKLSDIAVHALNASQQPKASLGSLEVKQLQLNLLERELEIGQLTSSNLNTSATRLADGQLDWQQLFAQPQADQTSAANSAPSPTDASQSEPEKPWRIRLQQGQLNDYRVELYDRQPKAPVKLLVGPLDLEIANFDSQGTSPFSLELKSGIGDSGSIASQAELTLSPLQAKLVLQARDIDLRVAQAYLAPFVRIDLQSGKLSSDLALEMAQGDDLALNLNGDLQITQLHTKDSIKQRDFIKWPRLSVEGLQYQHGKQLTIGKVDVQQPYLRFVINEDRSTNISELLVPQAASTEPAQHTSQPLAIRIGGIQIHDGSGHFADFSLQPAFATALQGLNGSIGTLDNQSNHAAKVDIKGNVDRYAPVSIQGELTPFDPLQKLDIATSFKRVELTTLTPYSGKFAGYRIRKGRLSLDLHYRINQGQLEADNKLVLEQLQLGERVDSPDAVDLPVRLAVALLKDSQGNINIELPVRGDLNDPQFSVIPIVWQTVRNLVVRAVQAPFKLLGGLAGGGDADLSQVPFAAASSQLDEQAKQNLDTLAKALQERPALRLEVEGGYSIESDGPGLAQARLEREYQSNLYRILQRRGEKVPASADLLEVPDSEKAVLLEAIYRSRLNQQPPADWAELDRDDRQQALQGALIEYWSTNETSARLLAQQRAASIKQYLVEQAGLDSERVYMVDVQTVVSDEKGLTPSTLHLTGE